MFYLVPARSASAGTAKTRRLRFGGGQFILHSNSLFRRRLLAADFAVQPGLGEGPIPVSRARRDGESLRRLFDGEPGEAVQLHQLGCLRVAFRKSGQGLIEGQQVIGGNLDRELIRVQLDALTVAAMLLPALASR